MEKYRLPISTFELFDESEETNKCEEISQLIRNTPDDKDVGFIIEVDLIYPDGLHDLHSEFLLAATKESIDALCPSQYQERLLDQMNTRTSPAWTKLILTIFPDLNYTLHYQTLKLYVELGLTVAKLHRVLSFKKGKWCTP